MNININIHKYKQISEAKEEKGRNNHPTCFQKKGQVFLASTKITCKRTMTKRT